MTYQNLLKQLNATEGVDASWRQENNGSSSFVSISFADGTVEFSARAFTPDGVSTDMAWCVLDRVSGEVIDGLIGDRPSRDFQKLSTIIINECTAIRGAYEHTGHQS